MRRVTQVQRRIPETNRKRTKVRRPQCYRNGGWEVYGRVQGPPKPNTLSWHMMMLRYDLKRDMERSLFGTFKPNLKPLDGLFNIVKR